MHLHATSVRESIWQEDVPHAPFIARHRVCTAVPPVKIADEGERMCRGGPFAVTDAASAAVEPEISVPLAYLSEEAATAPVCLFNFSLALEVARIPLAQLRSVRF